jgi:hypothetical protein
MKNLQVEDVTYMMLAEISKKHSMKPTAIMDELVNRTYNEMKQRNRKVL